jgi:hypothetical protein
VAPIATINKTRPRSGGQSTLWNKEINKNQAAPTATSTLPFSQKASDLEIRLAASQAPPYPVIGPSRRQSRWGNPSGNPVGATRRAIPLGSPFVGPSFRRCRDGEARRTVIHADRRLPILATKLVVSGRQTLRSAMPPRKPTIQKSPRVATRLHLQYNTNGNRENSKRRCCRWPARCAGEPPINTLPMSNY